jgi:hypothetical protein
MTFRFSKTFGAFTDLLQLRLKLSQLFGRDTLERAFDECGVPPKDRDKHFLPFVSQRHCSDPSIGAALYTAYKPFLV